jgi:hypothetical protein
MTSAYDEFVAYQKFSYRVVSKPNQSLLEFLKNTNFLFTNFAQKSSYIKDIKYLIAENHIPLADRLKLKRSYQLYRLSDLLIIIYGITSLHWHYKKNYFNSGSKLIEAYIVGKVFFIAVLIGFTSLLLFKHATDPIMYGYFGQKEREWDDRIVSRQEENVMMRQKKKTFEKINKY